MATEGRAAMTNEAELWTSECGKYLAYRRPNSQGGIEYDVIEIGTNEVWFGRRYIPTGFDDDDPRFRYPEFSRMVVGWSNAGRTTRTGQYIRAFGLSFCEQDQATALATTFAEMNLTKAQSQRYGKAMFRRMVSRRHARRYAQTAAIVTLSLFAEQADSPHAEEIRRRAQGAAQ
jgi:hypothetical protein